MLNHKHFQIVVLMALLTLVSFGFPPAYADVDRDDFPRFHEIFFKILHPETTAMVAARAGTLDTIMNISEASADELQNMSWTITPDTTPGRFNAFAPGLKCWVEDFSSSNDTNNFWTLCWLHWNVSAKENATYHIPGPVATLHPGEFTSIFEAEVMMAIMDVGVRANPFSGNLMPWGVYQYIYAPFDGLNPYGQPVNGTVATFDLRPGIRWHDGQVADANDVKFSWECIDEHTTFQFPLVSATYVNSTVETSTRITVWYNGTGQDVFQEYAKSMFWLAPQIYSTFSGNTVGFKAFRPWEVDYTTHTGNPKPLEYPFLTCLIGVGPYVLHDFDPTAEVIRVDAAGNSFASNFLREDINFDGIVDITDITEGIRSFGSDPGHERWANGASDVTCDGIVDITDVVFIITRFPAITLP
ncbi:MAG: hypothetical protein JSV05_03925 [Candidatus Bathyarchaeota archaeon]|nr:MAG: hypothetical protein JSV05_03925 [Candidatus Bathyarchaeota archaeon]